MIHIDSIVVGAIGVDPVKTAIGKLNKAAHVYLKITDHCMHTTHAHTHTYAHTSTPTHKYFLFLEGVCV